MSDEHSPPHRSPIPAMIVVLLLIGGGWYFFHHYKVTGLQQLSVESKVVEDGDGSEFELISYRDDAEEVTTPGAVNPFAVARQAIQGTPAEQKNVRRLRIAAWSLDGIQPDRLGDPHIQENMVQIIRQFDLIALQHVPAQHRDLLPRLLDAINKGEQTYELVKGKPTGPPEQRTTLAFLLNSSRVQVDRSQTYTVADPHNAMTFDPLVAWFRVIGPDLKSAWTFSMVNIQIDLERAADEVALLSQIMAAVRFDGRGEDDVVLAGVFQADDAYLLPTMGGEQLRAAVHRKSTDVLGKHQISNILVDGEVTSAYTSRGGVLDFLRVFNLSIEDAQAISSQIPVYAEFHPLEGTLQ